MEKCGENAASDFWNSGNQTSKFQIIMASGTPKPDGSQAQNPTVPNGSEPTMVPK